jgi:hypothetical protein
MIRCLTGMLGIGVGLLTWQMVGGCTTVGRAEESGIAQALREKPTTAEGTPWVRVGADGRLVYRTDDRGNRIPDFSNIGYKGGVRLPDVPTVATLAPSSSGDDTARIQAALDSLGQRAPDTNGFRGALLLKRGTYRIAGTVRITASGAVLRGEGQGMDGTVLLATGKGQRSLIVVGGRGTLKQATETRQNITDEYVPAGARIFSVENAAGYRVGDTVIVNRASTAEWIHTLGMDRIPMAADGGTVQWKPGSKDLPFDRVITRIEGNRITVDAPLGNSIERDFGPGTLTRYTFPERTTNVGVENLRGDSEYTSPTDEDHGWKFIEITATQDAWVRHVTAIHYGYSCVSVERAARSVTVEDCTCLDPVSQITGGRRYSFNLVGQLVLFQRCKARKGRHDFVLSSSVPGPNAFVDCIAEDAYADSGPHHRWSVACLFDNVLVTAAKGRNSGIGINIRNRGNSGTGHGWTGAYQVVWNCEAPEMNIANPPTARNWVIGSKTPNRKGNGEWESFGTPVEPKSLYRAQLAERIGNSTPAGR